MYYGFDPTIIILIPAIIFTIYAQGKVKRAYNTYSRIPTQKGISGQQAARMILDNNGMGHVPIRVVQGELTDNYDPVKDVMHLSNGICNGSSIASVAVAAHESGHAIQDGTNYGFLKFRIAMVPVVNLVSGASWPLIIIGILMVAAGKALGGILFDIGVIMFLVVVLFHTVTLPVEFNASRRALAQLTELGIVDETEIKGAKKVLSAAAMTYVAALAVSVLNLVRILAIRGSSN
ncbi:MAG: zinc metallopeptidase [Bacillota bacterium]|nr:zinc metallopeptidase [Bacillota bacterium]